MGSVPFGLGKVRVERIIEIPVDEGNFLCSVMLLFGCTEGNSSETSLFYFISMLDVTFGASRLASHFTTWSRLWKRMSYGRLETCGASGELRSSTVSILDSTENAFRRSILQ